MMFPMGWNAFALHYGMSLFETENNFQNYVFTIFNVRALDDEISYANITSPF